MRIPHIVPIVLWSLVFICGTAVWLWTRSMDGPAAEFSSDLQPGAAMVEVPWRRFADVPPFELVESSGQTFDSRSLAGRPFLINFFFTNCPSICRQLNSRMEQLHHQFRGTDVAILSITCDPERDTKEVLQRYSASYQRDAQSWKFLTGPNEAIKQLADDPFRVIVDPDTHTDSILLVDRWGRYRDRFRWDEPQDMERLNRVMREVLAERQPPLDAVVMTRNVWPLVPPRSLADIPWVRDFQLLERNGQPLHSRDFTGQVWIAKFFLVNCPTICTQQTQWLAAFMETLGERSVPIVNITTDPDRDTPAALRTYARQFADSDAPWLFLTGDYDYIRRIHTEMFRQPLMAPEQHSTKLFVIDRWGRVRGQFDWQQPDVQSEILALVDRLAAEPTP